MSDGIVLVGLPGSGKTTVGARVAQLLIRPFVDIDAEVERISGRSPARLITDEGEPALRAVERRAVEAATGTPGAVIATGGGTVLDPLNRWRLMEHGIRIRLDAPIETLAKRLQHATPARPLLGADIEAGLARTRIERAPVYSAVDAVVDTSRDVEATASDVIAAARSTGKGWRPLLELDFDRRHPYGPPTGRLAMGTCLASASLTGALAQNTGGRASALADRRALGANPPLRTALSGIRMCELNGGEEVKSFGQVEQILRWLSDMMVERTDPLVVVGGGTIGDAGGFAASVYRRGIPLVSVPTTWLAQADSSIGGKVGLDLPGAKNALGAFWPAWSILADVSLIAGLPPQRRRDGLAECIKAAIIGDPVAFELAEARGRAAVDGDDPAAAFALTERAARLKLAVVDRDPYETGERRLLNLGHTIGHALEVESSFTLNHGDAVALGLRAVSRISSRRGAQPNLAERIDSVLHDAGFPMTRSFNRPALIAALGSDKKRVNGRQHWILPMAIGEVIEVDDVTERELKAALDAISE